ncbi:dethiobiotin synthase [Acidaminococcus fermentans]|uniref:dethiobiotin synthase n=1 Tax=Acidaminococcus fermentans TaxID=905 RepID=UPI0024201FFF|nr:dethiobiotin synthase [Acidaminococcus fermentans]MDD6288106.1 dethiobiotin synthase [Acidaminococcus fermentans]MEE0338643.1 dethiobiotin synthase [Acidaminococcus fermentans]
MGKAIFVTGTGTDVGKTYVTGLLVKKIRDAGLDGSYYKAALSGAEPDGQGNLVPGDAAWVKETAGLKDPLTDLVTYVYQEAVSPHLAARINHRPVELETIREAFQKARARHEYLTMEGSGGILCPLRWDERQHLLLEDMIRALDLGCLLVADAGLGTINSTVLTVEYLQHRSIPVRGILFNRWKPGDRMQEDNRAMVEELTGIPVLACVKEGDRELEGPLDGLLAAYA